MRNVNLVVGRKSDVETKLEGCTLVLVGSSFFVLSVGILYD